MKCFAITTEGTHCSREVVSGNTIALDGRIVRLCNQHYRKYVNRKPKMFKFYTSEPMYTAMTNVQEDNTMTMNEEFDFHAARECSSAYRTMCPNKPMTIIHEYSEGYELSSGVCLECAMIARKTIANESSYFSPTKSEELRIQDWENAGYDMSDGFTKSNSYIVPEEDTMNKPIIPTRLCCGQKHLGDLCPDGTTMCCSCFEKVTLDNFDMEEGVCKSCVEMDKKMALRDINTTITDNAIKENNVPNSPVPGSSDRGDKWIKCVKCSKEVGTWYHANVADVRTCMGAAPAPVKRVYKTDVLTGETVLTNSDLRFFYDSSKAVVFAKAKELREAGVHVFKVAKATKGNQDWYVEYKS